VRAQNLSFSVIVEADAAEAEIVELIRHTDCVAEIPNSLRLATPVRLAEITALPRTSR
jgi:hypothetical protein